jgi:hypothetical protein
MKSLYLNNKYSKYYFDIIKNSKVREIDKNIYTEKHHIIPKCFGGLNKSRNLTVLTAKEHFICHLLLTKMTKGKYKAKMVYALARMVRKGNGHHKRYIPNSRIYSIIKKDYYIVNRERMMKNNPMNNPKIIYRHKIATKKRGKTLGMTGKSHSKSTKQRMSESHKGKTKGINHRKSISNSMKKISSDIHYINPMDRPGIREKHRNNLLLSWKKRKGLL